MILDLLGFIKALMSEPKGYQLPGTVATQTVYNARSGRPITLETATRFLSLARQQDPTVVGLRLANDVAVCSASALEALTTELAQLRAERADLGIHSAN